MVVIRLQRGGRTHSPVYTIVAADKRCARNGRFLERLGQYNPQAEGEDVLNGVKAENIKAWLDKGAVLSDTVRTLLKRAKVQL
jgi:small subunit ribosomal protein S16